MKTPDNTQAQQFKGLTFRLGKYRIGLWWTLLDISDGMNGRIYFFPWHPLYRCWKIKGLKTFQDTEIKLHKDLK